MRIAALSAAAAAAPLLLPLGSLGFALMVTIVLGAFAAGAHFGFRIIEESARGFLYPGEYPSANAGSGFERASKFAVINLFLLLFVGAVAFLARGSGFVIGFVGIVLSCLALPAILIRLIRSGSLGGALSPLGIAQVVLRIGKPYAVLCAFVFCLLACQYWVIAVLAGMGGVTAMLLGTTSSGGGSGAGVGALAAFGLMWAVFWYAHYVTCAVIGYAMYQFADSLDITVVGPGERRHGGRVSAGRVDLAKRTRDALIAKMVARGEVREAIEMLNDDLSERPSDLSLHARLHSLLLAEGNGPRIESHTDRYLGLLMKSDNAREALPLVEEALGRNANWAPRQHEHVVPLAKAALDGGNPQLAARLIRGFDRKHRLHPDVPHAYLLGVRILIQTGAAPGQARQLLQHLAARFPDHPATVEARRAVERPGSGGRT